MIATVAAIEGLAPPRPPPLTAFDQKFYLGSAWDLLHHRRFTDGYYFAPRYPQDGRPPGMRFGPLVPAFLAATASLDPTFRADLDCLVETRGDRAGTCGHAARLPRRLQVLMATLALGLVWPIARTCGLAFRERAIALALALLTAPMLLSEAAYLMTESAGLLLTTAASLGLARTIAAPLRWSLFTGLALGLATLARPDALLLVPVACALAAGLCVAPHRFTRLAACGLIALGASLAIGPWVARNATVLGTAGVSAGYAGHTLAQRVSFDRMTDRQIGLALVCWLPDGNGLGRAIAGSGTCDRFGWDDPDGFYQVGMRVFVPRTLKLAGGPAHHVAWLVRHEILPHLGRHLATTVPLALRGLWIDHWWGAVLAPMLAWLISAASRDVFRGEAGAGPRATLAISFAALSMLALHAFVAVNQPRYNLMLIPPLAIAGGVALAQMSTRIWSAIRARATAT